MGLYHSTPSYHSTPLLGCDLSYQFIRKGTRDVSRWRGSPSGETERLSWSQAHSPVRSLGRRRHFIAYVRSRSRRRRSLTAIVDRIRIAIVEEFTFADWACFLCQAAEYQLRSSTEV